MAELKCPERMVLIKSGRAMHPDEPPFCIAKTEAPQKPFMEFLKEQFPSEYKEVVAKLAQTPTVRGDKKPAVFAKWGMAQAYCHWKYKDGDLSTNKQWEKACGDKTYCTATGKLNHTEAIYDVAGPSDVGSTPASRNGVQDMTGNVWEWIKNGDGGGYKYVLGGSWLELNVPAMPSDEPPGFLPSTRHFIIGVRCVAVPEKK